MTCASVEALLLTDVVWLGSASGPPAGRDHVLLVKRGEIILAAVLVFVVVVLLVGPVRGGGFVLAITVGGRRLSSARGGRRGSPAWQSEQAEWSERGKNTSAYAQVDL